MSDLIVIGAGPAGIAAALAGAEAGCAVTLLDEQPRAGGQIWRDAGRAGSDRARILGKDYLAGAEAVAAVARAGIHHVPRATVWKIDPDGTVAWTDGRHARQARAGRLILATGALERPVPIPGWTLPGVMTAGAGQILLKASGILAQRAVLAGSGPLLYLLAAQMCRAGTPPLALVETRTPADLRAALPHLPGALRGWRTMAKGLGLLAEIRRAGVARHRGATDLAVLGDGRAEALAFRSAGRDRRIPCETVLLHMGVVPNTQASRSLGLEHRWDPAQRCFAPVTDRWGRSSIREVYVAGDGAGIAGAGAAVHAGRIAGLHAALSLGRLDQSGFDRHAALALRALATERAPRAFLDAAYPPAAEILSPADPAIVCRCEEVTAGQVREAARQGCLGPNQAKAFLRAGMGPCQGRYCGLTVTMLLAEANGLGPEETGSYRIRPPLKPVTLGELAAMDAPADG